MIDRATRERRDLTGGVGWSGAPAFSPDGRQLAVARGRRCRARRPGAVRARRLRPRQRRRAGRGERAWIGGRCRRSGRRTAASIVFTADDEGGVSIFRVDLADDTVTRLAGGAAFSDVARLARRRDRVRAARPTRTGRRTSCGSMRGPPTRSRSSFGRRRRRPGSCRGPPSWSACRATADDGVEIGSWLLRPAGASAREAGAARRVRARRAARDLGRLVTGAGTRTCSSSAATPSSCPIRRCRPATGRRSSIAAGAAGAIGRTRTCIAAVDGVLERPDIDATRTALMGGSFGGYMANWVAGHTDRFKAIVTHASLWELRGFHGTTDDGVSWEQEIGDPYVDASHVPRQLPARGRGRHQDADARDPRRARRARADLRGPSPVDRPAAPRRGGEVPVLPRREPLDRSSRRTRGSGTRRCSRSSTGTCWTPSGNVPRCSSAPGSGYHPTERRTGDSPAMTDIAGDPGVAADRAPPPARRSRCRAGTPPGIIATDDERYNATLIQRVDQHESLAYFWVRFDEEPTPVRARAVHDDRRVRRRQDRAAALLGRVGAGRRGRHGLRVLPAARRRRDVHADPVGPARGSPDADDRPEGQVPARARRRPSPPVRRRRGPATRRSSR